MAETPVLRLVAAFFFCGACPSSQTRRQGWYVLGMVVGGGARLGGRRVRGVLGLPARGRKEVHHIRRRGPGIHEYANVDEYGPSGRDAQHDGSDERLCQSDIACIIKITVHSVLG